MRILATSDGSDHARHVLPHVGRLAAALGADLTVLRVLEQVSADAATLEQAKANLQSDISGAGIAASVQVDSQHRDTDIPGAISRIIASSGASLLAMDSRGSGAVRRATLGSVAMSLLRSVDVPLMLTSAALEPAKSGAPYRIAITSDGSKASAKILDALRPILEGGQVAVTLLRVVVPRLGDAGKAEAATEARELEALKSQIPAACDVTVVVDAVREFEKVEAAIIRAARATGADALAMSTHGHSTGRTLFAGSVAMGVLGLSPVPVILTRA